MKTTTAILILLLAASTIFAGEPGQTAFPRIPVCNMQGTWLGSAPPFLPELGDQGLVVAETVSAPNYFRREWASVLHPFNPEFSFGGLFPEATAGSPDSYGVYRRAANDQYEFTSRSYFVKAPPPGVPIRGEIHYFLVIRGTVECLDENTKQVNAVFSVYSNIDNPDLVVPPLGVDGVHDQDLDDDGFEDPGEEPVFSGLLPIVFKRVTVQPAPPVMVP